MKLAALDLGSNTFLCLIAEVEGGRITKILSDEVEMVRLGQGVAQSRKFHPEALERAERALTKFSQSISRGSPEGVLAMATSAARDVSNAEELFQMGRRHGIPIEIIPGGREAEITYRGALSSPQFQSPGPRWILDVGGGSTEVIFGEGPLPTWAHSLNVGVVRMKERFIKAFPIEKDSANELRDFLRSQFKTLESQCPQGLPPAHELVAVAGTPTEIARLELGGTWSDKVEGLVLTEKRLSEWSQTLAKHTPQEIEDTWSVSKGRSDVLWVGVEILRAGLEFAGLQELKVSMRGVRHGVALDLAQRLARGR